MLGGMVGMKVALRLGVVDGVIRRAAKRQLYAGARTAAAREVVNDQLAHGHLPKPRNAA